jgi:hypothetical protein
MPQAGASLLDVHNVYSAGVTYDHHHMFIVQATGWGTRLLRIQMQRLARLLNHLKGWTLSSLPIITDTSKWTGTG